MADQMDAEREAPGAQAQRKGSAVLRAYERLGRPIVRVIGRKIKGVVLAFRLRF